MTKTFKTKVYLDPQTAQYCKRAFGVRRCIWNWAVAECLKPRSAGQRRPTNFVLDKLYRQNLKSQPDKCFVWLAQQQTSPRLMQEVLKDVQQAFIAATKTKGKAKVRFKSRKDQLQTFRLHHCDPSVFKIESEYHVSFAGGPSGRFSVRTRESLAFLQHTGVKLCTLTISCQAGNYWMCISYEKPNRAKHNPAAGSRIGLDLGVVKSVVGYDGSTYSEASFNTKHSLKLDRMAKAQNQKLSRQKRGSKRYEKTILLQQKRAAKAARIRKNELEVYTTSLVHNYEKIIVDNFTFKGAMNVANHDKLYRCMKYEFTLRLGQKLEERDGNQNNLVEIPHHRGVKTTRKCSCCGSEKVRIKNEDRTVRCLVCGFKDDRDRNAAHNAYNYR